MELVTTGFLEEAPGVKSSTRLMSVLALLCGVGLGSLGMYTGIDTHGLPELLIIAAFTGKVGGKAVEMLTKKTG